MALSPCNSIVAKRSSKVNRNREQQEQHRGGEEEEEEEEGSPQRDEEESENVGFLEIGRKVGFSPVRVNPRVWSD